jgi:HEAT repeat protein
MPKTMRLTWTLGVVSLATVLGGAANAGPSKAQRAGKGAPTAPPLAPEIVTGLKSDDATVLKSALDDARLAGAGAAPAIPVITSRLATGLPYPLAESALDTLADIGASDSADVISAYASHRDPRVRRAAIRALAKSTGAASVPRAAAALRSALGDPDAQVRALAATGLGSLKAKSAVPDLFRALDHKVYEAAVSIGQLCAGTDCDQFLSRLGRLPFDVMTSGLDQLLFRPSSEVTDEAKVAIVLKVRDLGTRDANHFLHDVQARWPSTGSQRVKREIDGAVLATLSSPGGGS